MFLSGLVLSRHPLVGRDTTWLMVSALLSAAGMAAYGLSTGIWMAMAAFFLNGIGLSGLHIFGTPILVRHTKEQERGRVFAASSSVTMGGMLLATGVAGAIGELFPPRPIIVCAALVCGLNALIGGVQIRRYDTVAGEGSSGSTR
ncbi:MAG: MFS transporter [Actinobacteria bacterium]|nr:MFS transporter [Actinomycetota bacterium]